MAFPYTFLILESNLSFKPVEKSYQCIFGTSKFYGPPSEAVIWKKSLENFQKKKNPPKHLGHSKSK